MPELLTELRELVTAYVRQETVDPIKGLARWVTFGLLGAVSLGAGVSLLAVGGLRALQTETGDTLTGTRSWVPYLIVFAALLVGGLFSLWLASPRRHRARGGAR